MSVDSYQSSMRSHGAAGGSITALGGADADLAQTARSTRMVNRWLYTVSVLIAIMVVFGGYVRLTRSGLSIVEWNVITGILPPLGEEAWQQTFAKYQQTPEYQKVNVGMALADYKAIFYVEYFHRLIARIAGLIVVIPLLVMLIRGVIPWRRSGVYLAIAFLFGFQGFLGWYMVSSGLVNAPAVSHYRLTAHLLLALGLLALCLWTALDNRLAATTSDTRARFSMQAVLAISMLVVLVIQIAYGGLVAGLKAGHASDTFPLMFGYLIPPGIFSVIEPWWQNLLATAATVHFVHRWFAFAVLIAASLLYVTVSRPPIRKSVLILIALIGVQIVLGVSVIWFHVPLVLALSHQATALLLFVIAIVLNHQVLYLPRTRRA